MKDEWVAYHTGSVHTLQGRNKDYELGVGNDDNHALVEEDAGMASMGQRGLVVDYGMIKAGFEQFVLAMQIVQRHEQSVLFQVQGSRLIGQAFARDPSLNSLELKAPELGLGFHLVILCWQQCLHSHLTLLKL